MLQSFSQPLKTSTFFFHEIYTPTIWTVDNRKRNARILGGINRTLTSGIQLSLKLKSKLQNVCDNFTVEKSIGSTQLVL